MPELRYRSRSYKRTFRRTPEEKQYSTTRRKNHQNMFVQNAANSFMQYQGEDHTK